MRYHFLALPNGIALVFVTNFIQLSICTYLFKYIILLEAKRSETTIYHTLKGTEIEAALRSETTNSFNREKIKLSSAKRKDISV